MNPIEALEYLERVVEVDTDVDPCIHEAVTVLSTTIERERRMARVLEVIIDSEYKTFSTEWVRAKARRALGLALEGREGSDEVSGD